MRVALRINKIDFTANKLRTTPRRLTLAGYKFSHTYGHGLVFIKDNKYHFFNYVNPSKGTIGWETETKKIIVGNDINLLWTSSIERCKP